ncbi:MAG TPA: S8 family serine peptidase [Roseiarcus sp.]|nr:S8 family serine peptidase [Roseiarcus sp.]
MKSREKQFIIGHRAPSKLSLMSSGPVSYDPTQVIAALSTLPDVKIVRRIKQSGLTVLSTTPSTSHDVVVVRTGTPERAEHIKSLAQSNPALIVERDYLLQHLASFRPQFTDSANNPTQVATSGISVRFHVEDQNGGPLENAEIVVYGNSGSEDQGKTDARGDATITIRCGSLNETAALYVKPAKDYWERFVERPALDEDIVNIIELQPLTAFVPAGFSGPRDNPFVGWGQRIMGLLGLDPDKCDGAGVRVAIIDSGCDANHPALNHIKIGRDYTNLDENHEPDQKTWRTDAISHGTHCAGVIAGNGTAGHIRGFAPKAEVHVLKVFPGGAFNNLIAAINYCIDNQMHVVNCSLGSDVGSELVAQAIERARNAGVALFVAAGNSATQVQFPANVPGVLCVSAIGQAGNFPDNTYHARTVPNGATVVPGQVYPAKFTCHGSQVGVCAPGVGIISSVPNGGYAAWDGTSMADPHLTGMGALVAAHHPAVAGKVLRNAAWVDQLFQLVFSSAQAVGLSPEFGGVGLPIVSKVLKSDFLPQKRAEFPPMRQLTPDIIAQMVKSVIAALPVDMVAPSPGRMAAE